ncbi:peptidoglycan DD-metalloendopeptidase family protein [Rossellomorea aquimaris]|uniref:peptidoglycan DD-metalloendopeptidase family protein n=1 Tax=Rossellomorea aquimaris TaxID=189382 RepID=UPI003CE89698
MKKGLKVLISVILFMGIFGGLYGKEAGAASNFIWPVDGSHTYSRSLESGHNGIDITKYDGAPIKASAAGEVIYAQYHSSQSGNGDYGNLVAIKHSIGGVAYITKYAHMKSGLKVSVGQWVGQGTVIGYLGNTGDSTGPHLHFEILKNPANMWDAKNAHVEPLNYLEQNDQPDESTGDINKVVQVTNAKWGIYSAAKDGKWLKDLKTHYDNWILVADKVDYSNSGTKYYRIRMGNDIIGWVAAEQLTVKSTSDYTVKNESYQTIGYYRSQANSSYINYEIPPNSKVKVISETADMYMIEYDYRPQYILKNPPKRNSEETNEFNVIKVDNPKWGLYKVPESGTSNYKEPLSNYDNWTMVTDKYKWVNGTKMIQVRMGDDIKGWTAADQVSNVETTSLAIADEAYTTIGYYRAEANSNYINYKIPANSKVRLISETTDMYLIVYDNRPQYILKTPPKITGEVEINKTVKVTNPKWGIYSAASDGKWLMDLGTHYNNQTLEADRVAWSSSGKKTYRLKDNGEVIGWAAAEQFTVID